MSSQAMAMGAFVLLSAISAFHVTFAQPGYILTLPRTLRAGSDETFCITLHGVDDPSFVFSLRLSHKTTQEEHDYQYEMTDSFSQCMKFLVPNETGSYSVVLRNDTTDIAASGPTEVEVKSKNLITLVQTDKPIYKPGQTGTYEGRRLKIALETSPAGTCFQCNLHTTTTEMQFRVLTLTRDLMSRTGTIQSIFIKNPNDIRVKQWLNIETEGMTSYYYPMPAEPKLGEWKIEVTVEGETTLQIFKVEEYVLPRFEVKITPPPYLLVNASTIDGKICAEYTYGKPVNGYVSMEVCLIGHRYTGRPCYIQTREINGCYKFSVNTSEVEMANTKYYLYGSKLQIKASVRERSTGAVVNKTTEEPTVTYDPLKITLEDDTDGFFKPIFPYHGRARVTTPDGKPAPDELIKVIVTDYRNDIRLVSNYSTDSDGMIYFSVCDIITDKTQDFKISARAILYAESTEYYGLSNSLYMPRAYKTVKQWYSPSKSYISIPRYTRTVPCGEELEVSIPYSTVLNSYTKFYYQVMSRGRILHTGHKLHHFLKHDSTEFLEVPMASCLQKVPEPSPPAEIEEGQGGEGGEGKKPPSEEMLVEEPTQEAVEQPLGVRRRRSTGGELGERRDGEEKKGEEELHEKDKQGEGKSIVMENVHEELNLDRNGTNSDEMSTSGTEQEVGRNNSSVHEVSGNVTDEFEEPGSLYGEISSTHELDKMVENIVHVNKTKQNNKGGRLSDTIHNSDSNVSNLTIGYSDDVTGNGTVKYDASDTKSDVLKEGNFSHGDVSYGRSYDDKHINDTHETYNLKHVPVGDLSDKRDTPPGNLEASGNITNLNINIHEEDNITHVNISDMHADNQEHGDLTQLEAIENNDKHAATLQSQSDNNTIIGKDEIKDTKVKNKHVIGQKILEQKKGEPKSGGDHKTLQEKGEQILGEQDKEQDSSRNQTQGVNSEQQEDLQDYAGYGDDDDDDDYDDDYDDDDYDEYEDDIIENQISEDLYRREPIHAAIFDPFGLRRKRSSGIEGDMPGVEVAGESRTEGEGGHRGEEALEEPPASPPPPPTPSRHVSHFTIRVPVTDEMSPSASLLVYYVREDGETVADSINFNVEACFKNKVKFDFAEKKVVPGGEATLRLQAEPGSLCSVGVVDKSINLLGGDHQLTPEKMFDILKGYGVGRDKQHYYYSDKEYCERKAKDQEDQSDYNLYGGWWHYSSRYVDAIEAFRQSGMAVSTNMIMETRPCSKEYAVYYDDLTMEGLEGGLPGPGAGMFVPLPLGINYRKSEKQKPSGTTIRSYFPETWLWELQKISESGKLELRKNAPHTITEWVGNIICTSQSAGLGVSPMTSLTTFQPFFLSMTLPYAAVRGERLPIHVTIFNYLQKCLYMQVNLETSEGLSVVIRDHLKLPFCLCGGKSKTQSYFITPEDIGRLPVIAKAEIVQGTCDNNIEPDTEYLGLIDSVKRELFVKVEGVTQEYTKSLYICPKDSPVLREEIDLPLPERIVADSARGHISVVGDIMGPALSNLDHLVQLPTGCGEQTMITFTPNIYVLKYLTMTFQLTDSMKLLTERYMEIGYNRELNYAHDDGSFSAFGKSDTSGSTWLTAFVVKSFAQAQRFVFIDEAVITKSVAFLKSTSMENGCFREVGKVFSSYMMGGLGKLDHEDDTALTAFVIVALLEAHTPSNDPVLKRALRCLVLQPLDEMDTYTLTLVAYALTLNDPDSQHTDNIMVELNNRVISDGTLSYWGRDGSKPPAINTWHYQTAPPAEIEMTSYGLMATMLYYEEDAISKAQPMVMWLSQQRNSFGGFSSTQDTVLGLQALSEFASKTFTGNSTDLTINFDGNTMSATHDVITGINGLLLQKSVIKRLPNTLKVSANGTGCALVQASVKYNVLPKHLGIDQSLFNLSIAVRRSRSRRSDCTRRSMRICVSFKDKKDFSAGMSLLTVKMVTAWTPVVNSLIELKSKFPILSMKKYENDVEKGLIAFYFDELDLRKRCFEFDVEQDRQLAVSDPKPAEIQAYQYYERDVTVITSYNIKTTCGTKAEIPEEETVDRWPAGVPVPVQTRINDGMPPLPTQKVPDVGCPVCLHKEPDNFNELICQSKAIYKALAGRNGKAPMKIKADLRPKKKTRIDKFASFSLGPECQCDLLNPPNEKKRVRRLLILSKRDKAFVQKDVTDNEEVGHMIRLDNNSIIINLDANRPLERETRKKARRCKRKLL